ncbi:adenosylcobinamide-GDP ribazoletransferase [Paenibacillus lutrae]|uniref:Adenosylcobinamide-GDP ribazoletransferase n=1 Tax=Paenibacillus lutrae TaxID=2078573 RepID=A0A7X3FFY0_9BACL|nr:adenosylcobinamide-GDP ribazoletransferase [Paenibacillus lutrae]MVO98961.1 adenosylcobinamide-GDP ribazoletransferase [Paenibacillus lutrae]
MRTLGTELKSWLLGLTAALQFLTRLPVPVQIEWTPAVLRRSLAFYPLVGALLGYVLLGSAWLLGIVLPELPASVLLLCIWIGLTGALHLDGLMDTADGVLSHRPRERMLEIMKDSRVGAMGVIVCVLVILLKWSALYTILHSSGKAACALLVLVPVWSRAFMTAAVAFWPYARREGGMGGFFSGGKKPFAAAAAAFAFGISLAVLGIFQLLGRQIPYDVLWGTSLGIVWQVILTAVVLLSLTFAAGWVLASMIARKLGGLTGDTYGALNELLETVLLLAIAALVQFGF